MKSDTRLIEDAYLAMLRLAPEDRLHHQDVLCKLRNELAERTLGVIRPVADYDQLDAIERTQMEWERAALQLNLAAGMPLGYVPLSVTRDGTSSTISTEAAPKHVADVGGWWSKGGGW